ncbi:hypothetical protein [Desulfolutivibrio sulfoxidireducens]|uniref:hypothetical protein n=1 Tax=Desulfolutivibrio sulfoxidireducens TaxID=2773299 RepID=UPI00159D8DC5|nr:hypothetical protein [Desulfolutivibrio sulfoxidireducens]QLA16280.1 hypothetical protein GD605_09200 [Desulfolutivibrio sulfoxidireducens]QLA19828.1 hypothetical protein GD604_08800 [Desulfolutivibrio sulfoxidireducens]
MTTPASHSGIALARKIIRSLVVFGLIVYVTLVTADILLYHFGANLPVFTPTQKELLYSRGVFAAFRHPDYRPWLKGFVNAPGKPATTVSVDDTYRAYGVPLDNPPSVELSAVDALGWWNDTSPSQAQVLFLGDSFCYGAGAGTDNTIYRLFEKKTGLPDYAACKGGYGLTHYARLLETLTGDGLGPQNRFLGKTVYVLLYVGNDLSADILVYRQRQMDEMVGHARHLWIESIRNLTAFFRETRTLATGVNAQTTQPGQDSTLGYYPIFLKDGGSKDTPFAFHPFYRTVVNMGWFGPKQEEELRAVFAEMARVARERTLDVRFVVIPTALQVLYPRIDFTRLDPNSLFAKEAPTVVKNFNQLTAFAVSAAEAAGFPVLDMEPLLVGRADAAALYWPMDTHFTPLGNAVTVDAILTAFPHN